MLSPDEFIDDLLLHAEAPYNPQKAHEYYLLNRDLKGRSTGSQNTSSPKSSGSQQTSSRVKTSAPVLTSEQRQEQVNARVASLQTNLEQLKKELQDRLDAAKKKEEKEKEGPEKKEEKKEKKDPSAKEEKKSDLTVQQKKEKAVKSKEYYEEHKYDKLSVDQIRGEIKKIEHELKLALQQARSMMPRQSNSGQGKKSGQAKPGPAKPGPAKPGPGKVAQKKVAEVKPTGNFLTRITDWVNTLFR